MIGALLCLAAAFTTWSAARRDLGRGLALLFTWGYAYGLLRANVTDPATHFSFDSALLGLYAATLGRRPRDPRERAVRPWVLALIGWPCVVFLIPFQHPLVQLVGLRAAIFFLPCVLLGARLRDDDVERLALALAALNLCALAFALAELALGVPRFYPRSSVTELIYRSSDVAGGELRVPAVFANAHAYGGTMVASLPVLLVGSRIVRARARQAALLAGASAAALGVFICSARQPALYLLALLAYVVLQLRTSLRRKLLVVALTLAVGAVVATSDRLQRFTTLADTDAVASRLRGSANLHFLEMLAEHPLGEGLGSAAGTSIPYFLSDLARPQIGMENEWGRIALEQSLFGLWIWLAFVGATALRVPRGEAPGAPARRVVWAYVCMLWATAFVGTGMLTSIPQTALVLAMMGMLWRAPEASRGPAGSPPPAHHAAPPQVARVAPSRA